MRYLGWVLAGLVLASLSTQRWLALCVPVTQGRVLLEGAIVGVPAREGAEIRFDLFARILEGEVQGDGDTHPRHARVVWRDAPVVPRAGERWRLLVRLAPLSDAHNFSGPDTARFAFRDGVHLAGRVLPSALNARLELANSSVDTLRARVAARIGEGVADPDAAALLTALAVGLTDRMSADQWRVFNATGASPYGRSPRAVCKVGTGLLRDANLDAAVFCPTRIGHVRFNRPRIRVPVRCRGAKTTFGQRLRRICRTGFR